MNQRPFLIVWLVETIERVNFMMEELLDLCYFYRVYAQYYRGRWFIALGDFFGFGKTLPEAIENWCQEVEKKGLVK